MSTFPRLVGVLHLAPLPGSPRFGGDLDAIVRATAEDARLLEDAGFDAVIVENFGDAPFFPGAAPPETIAAMTACLFAARRATKGALGVNVLRNDAHAALAIAVATGASFVRVNVHVGARVTDQGIVEGRAHETLRLRRALGAEHVRLACDVDVKHAAPLAPRPLDEQTEELVLRGLADAVLVTGHGTGAPVDRADLATVKRSTSAPVLVASGATHASVRELLDVADGVIVGSCLRAGGRAGGRVDAALAREFVRAARGA